MTSPSTERAAPDTSSDLRAEIIELLELVRRRTLVLLQPVSDEAAVTQHDPLMSPIVWDLGHIASFEKLWLQQQLDRPVAFGEMPGVYNPFEHPRAERGRLPLLSLRDTLAELEQIRVATLERLAAVSFDAESPLLRGGYVYRMVAQHESQHQETILQTLQLKRGVPYAAPRAWTAPHGVVVQRDRCAVVRFPGGEAVIGTDDRSRAYDNERPEHVVELRPFEMDVYPVTNGDFADFMADGGYAEPRLWSDAGREWLESSGAMAPKYWEREGDAWTERVMDLIREIDRARPVCHVCFYEAEAFARWAGKRLPTEQEWETAATWTAPSQRVAEPWGDAPADWSRAGVDQLAFDTAPVGAYPLNVSPLGVYGMIGDVWEWTTTDFTGYPGFSSFPYPDYSEVFFGTDYKVLRGGSWATGAPVARSTFRNWDFPVRRQIFSGFRCARDI